jgi:hypothetical protein
VLVCSERRVLLAGCWWLVCSERKVRLAGGQANRQGASSHFLATRSVACGGRWAAIMESPPAVNMLMPGTFH